MRNLRKISLRCSQQVFLTITTFIRGDMKILHKIIIVSILIFSLASCNVFVPEPTETPVPTSTNTPTLTSTPKPTITSTPTETPTETPTITLTQTSVPPTETEGPVVLPEPSGDPASEWKGIPIMPAAIAGEGDGSGYSFIISASPDDVQEYYEKEMAELGWNMLATGQGNTSALILIFMKKTDSASVSIIPQPDGIIYVLLVK